MISRKLNPSNLKTLFSLSHYTTYTYTKPISNPYSTLINPKKCPNPLNPTKTLTPQILNFRSFSSKPISVPSLRDGNYDEIISKTLKICPGCGISMQETDPKQPGFFVTPAVKDENYKMGIDKNPVADETHVSEFYKKGFLVEFGENGENGENVGNGEKWKLGERGERPVVCARCHSLRNYGRVKDEKVENLLPDFDFDHTIGRRLNSVTGTRSVVVMVVDATDFDGSFPRKVAELVSNTIDENSRAWKEGKSGNVPRVVLVVTKIDLLPSSISPTGFEHWVRTRARENGATKLTKVHMVSSFKNWGLKGLVDDMTSLAGQRGHVWVIGAQNAGKSTLINAMAKCVGGKMSVLTEAPVPGTTLGIVRVEGVLPGQAKLFDTPGLLHPHQITSRLTREEQKLVHITKEMKPRTYRVQTSWENEYSIHVGGLMRLDVEEASVDSIYVTVWASPHLPLHMGKTVNVSAMMEDHFGNQLQPPIGKQRVKELGKWVRKEYEINGKWWESNCADIAAAGLGWFSIGIKGKAKLSVWTYEGIDITLRNALIAHRAHEFEVKGFTVSKIVSRADKSLSKQRRNEKKSKVGVDLVTEARTALETEATTALETEATTALETEATTTSETEATTTLETEATTASL
ncbi:P-loop containing nucleoside triphosphate hydrolases superfamily protein [Artemisia annua]|uniref:P-loop containing nucleoside triphosphate hydrolases superfamily protein n=1 Tax=Artemisia annua TaxID=35608 RepID=A0A2U1MH74_ARTAN|nr:P-loop containing nucleoside triphosphate hydrolases superfamily protein [Artemisia annua]